MNVSGLDKIHPQTVKTTPEIQKLDKESASTKDIAQSKI